MLKFVFFAASLLFLLSPATTQEISSRRLLQGRRVVVNEDDLDRLLDLVDEADAGTTFVFDSDLTLPDVITVTTENLTFTGDADNRPTITCASGRGAFRINGNGASIQNLVIRNCEATAVDIFDEMPDPFDLEAAREEPESIDVTVTNVDFLNNIGIASQSKAGGISLGFLVRLTAEGCRFVNNTGTSGGAVSSFGQSLEMDDCIFEDNRAQRSGGAVFALVQTDDPDVREASNYAVSNSRFVRNRVLDGSLDRGELTVGRGIPLESNPYIDFLLPSRSGGALLIDNFQKVLVENCTFDANVAAPAGGAIYLNDNDETSIRQSTFKNNRVERLSTISADPDSIQLGGAMFVAFVNANSKAKIEDCVFQNNTASYGGALHFVGPTVANFEVTRCSFVDNEATLGGGAVVIRHATGPIIERSIFLRNKAFVGGGILVTNGGGIRMLESPSSIPPTRFEGNVANDGGAMFVMGGGVVEIFLVIFERNQAVRNGGAICFIDSKAGGSLTVQDAKMFNNSAETGGALYLENLSTFNLRPGTGDIGPGRDEEIAKKVARNDFIGNKAVAGGAIYYRASNLVGNTFKTSGTNFTDNRVYRSISDIYKTLPSVPGRRLMQTQTSNVPLLNLRGAKPCHPGGGGAICLALSGLTNSAPIMVEISRSNFTRNRALSGGAMLISTDTGNTWQSSCSSTNSSATFLTNAPCRELRLRSLRFKRNRAKNAGGALLASSFDHIFYSDEPRNEIDTTFRTIDGVADGPVFYRNRVDDGGYGPNVAGTAVALAIHHPVINNGLLVADQTSGQLHPLPRIDINVLDGLNQTISDGIDDSTLRIRVDAKLKDASIASGQVVSTAVNGVATFDALTLSAPSDRYEIVFSVRGDLVASAKANVTIRECRLGERYNSQGSVCVSCTFESFTIYTQVARCEDCPDNARCKGNATWVPQNNYWHSSPFSVIMHECFHSDACSHRNRIQILERQHNDRLEEFLSRFDTDDPIFTNEEYRQCSAGYEGPLCGSCQDGYGHADGKTCVKCNSRSSTASVIFLLAVWQLMLLAVTIRSALVSIRDMNQLMAVAQQQAALASVPSRRATQTSIPSSSFGMDQDSMVSRRTAGMPGDATHGEIEVQYGVTMNAPMASVMPQPTTQLSPKQQYSAQFIVAAQHVSETIKIFVNFFQVTSVAVNINLEWSSSIKNMLSGMNSVAGFSNGASFTPMTCLLDSDSDVRSIHGVVLRIAFPLCLMVLVMGIFAIRWHFMRRSPHITKFVSHQFIRSRSIICFLVVGFFAYQSISEDLMGTVSCIKLDKDEMSEATRYDKPSLGVDYSRFSIAQGRYWTEDTNIECFSRHHAYLVGFLGIPGIILFLCGIPLYLLFFLLYKRHRNELMHINVLNTYGFIYQNYEDKFVYWEVMILIRKALIGAIVVFAYPLGANLQGIMALGVLILSLAIHLIATPFKYLPLNILEGCSLVVSIFTFYSGVVFNDENTSENAEVLLSVLLVIVNSLLGLVFIFTVFVYGDKYVVAKLKYLDAQTIPLDPISRMIMLASMLSEQFRRTVTTHINRTVRGRQRGAKTQISMTSMAAGSGTIDPPLSRHPTVSDQDVPIPSDGESQL